MSIHERGKIYGLLLNLFISSKILIFKEVNDYCVLNGSEYNCILEASFRTIRVRFHPYYT